MANPINSHQSSQNPLRLGFGASSAWSKSWFSEKKAFALVSRAIERGITHFDTASFYTGGVAETRLGEALAGHKSLTLEVSTKTGTRYLSGKPPIKDFSERNIRLDVETSLKRLGCDRLDILYLHGPAAVEIDRSLDILAALKHEGKINLAGVCGFKPSLQHAITVGQIDIIMGPYNIADLSHQSEFRAARAKGMRTVGIGVLVPGLGDKNLNRPKSFADIWYLLRSVKRNTPSMTEARKQLREIVEDHGHRSVEHVMLGFALAQTDIDTILTNTTRLAHLDANIDTAQSPPLSPALLEDLEQYSRRFASSLTE
jgi:D-threo-aldose 1-dehydrogenase